MLRLQFFSKTTVGSPHPFVGRIESTVRKRLFCLPARLLTDGLPIVKTVRQQHRLADTVTDSKTKIVDPITEHYPKDVFQILASGQVMADNTFVRRSIGRFPLNEGKFPTSFPNDRIQSIESTVVVL